MRINPLLVPLVAVLAMPFALGLSNSASLNTHKPLFGPGGGGPGPLPQCKSCSVGTRLTKNQSIADPGCNSTTFGDYPYILQQAYCQQWTCANGFYYTFTGWATLSTCVNTKQNATVCPTATCSSG